MIALLLAAVALPLLVASALASRVLRPGALALAAWTPLPALVTGLAVANGTSGEIAWLLLGTRLGVDTVGRPFLLATALVWLLAGWFAGAWLRNDARRTRFTAFFLVTQAGNIAVCMAQDAITFYLAFAMMTFAAYGLVVHAADAPAWRAGRIYIVMAVAGEALLVAGLLLAVSAAGSHRLAEIAAAPATVADPTLVCVLLLAGFGVKVGMPLLHFWLPLAHPVAPVPASAVLSAVMVKAGVLGWLRFLPLGVEAVPALGTATLAAGLLAMFYGAGVGLAQRDPKVVLAYSTVSQMGFITAGIGAGLLEPASWPLLLPAVTLFAVHHALAKSALFLGVGVAKRAGGTPAVLVGLALPALALAGAPWSSGASAKTALKAGLHDLPGVWPSLVEWALPLAGFATAALMTRLLMLLAQERANEGGNPLRAPWGASLGAVAALSLWPVYAGDPTPVGADSVWPILAAAVLAWAATRLRWRAPEVPPGDLVVLVERLVAALAPHSTRTEIPGRASTRSDARGGRWLRMEARLIAWRPALVLWLATLAALATLFSR